MPHYEVIKSWGKEVWFWNSDRYCYKHLYFNKGKGCSFHYHEEKDEMFHILRGTVTIQYSWGDDMEQTNKQILSDGMIFHVPPLMRHKIVANGLTDAVLVEVSTTHYEDDSYRIQEQTVGFNVID